MFSIVNAFMDSYHVINASPVSAIKNVYEFRVGLPTVREANPKDQLSMPMVIPRRGVAL